jgi:SAM-dependent methyltransferase
MLFLKKPYFPKPDENRMGNDGDLETARQIFYTKKNKTLWALMRNRFSWMNRYIDPEKHSGVELGCGIGVTKEFIHAKSLLLTDYAESQWLDTTNVDAMRTPFADEEFDFVICMNMIHHLPNAMRFFQETRRILKPQGILLVQEAHASFLLRLALRVMRKEGYSFEVDVFDPEVVLSDPSNPWSGNNAIGALLFGDHNRFHDNIPFFHIIQDELSECFLFLLSGGVTAKTFALPLSTTGIHYIEAFDRICTRFAPNIFAMQRSIALQKL